MPTGIKALPASKTIIYLTVIYIVGIVGMLTDSTQSLFIFLVPVNILMAVFVAAVYHKGFSKRFIIASFLIYVGGFLIEWIGIKTGLIFGQYSYGEGLGFKLAGVPPIMGLNWLLLVYGATSIAGRLFRKKYLIAIFGATLMVMYDIILEPSAITYNFWRWENDYIPLQNYMAWFISGFAFIGFFIKFIDLEIKNIVAESLFWLQLTFFGIIWMANNLTV